MTPTYPPARLSCPYFHVETLYFGRVSVQDCFAIQAVVWQLLTNIASFPKTWGFGNRHALVRDSCAARRPVELRISFEFLGPSSPPLFSLPSDGLASAASAVLGSDGSWLVWPPFAAGPRTGIGRPGLGVRSKTTFDNFQRFILTATSSSARPSSPETRDTARLFEDPPWMASGLAIVSSNRAVGPQTTEAPVWN